MDHFNIGIILDIVFSEDYPNSVPKIELVPTLNVEKENILDLEQQIIQEAENNIGMSMIFILAGLIKEWLDNNNIDPESLLVEESSEEEPEEEEKVFEGTPVTAEAFLAWRKKFIEETKPFKKSEKQTTTKLTGRQLFESDITLYSSDSKLMEEGEETSDISVASLKPKLEEVAAQVDWSLFADNEEIIDVEEEEDEE
ncbi:hypothetical protein DICPUDRAFT_157517 [Dictyostelium purpureum]|uniref:RWD domain-containing protein n=1 Tax=Dictyostelium purpureum TaxID=5786 RepID=F0ZZB6_DICPU|nr:uncharacterized protein DICPUDRAFT_157517 [Dictyostelium purpureum]EGC30697.1 hypothetical protein DICPUDRAFT_157517 [Dictyostelium purpureum]|eukprot:XP_003292760.1 hypothetical protein DICPUDRAFT_157517 [Dictyostelium purpureum]